MPSNKSKGTLADQVAAELGKQHPGLVSIGDNSVSLRLKGVIPTRCAVLDAAIGRGGIPMGKLTIVSGVEAGGKTTLALHLAAQVQSMDGIAFYMDKEHKLDVGYAKALGVDTSQLILSQPAHLEGCLSMMSKAVHTIKELKPGTPVLIVLDSINSARSREEFEGDYEDKHVGSQARVLSAYLPKLIQAVADEPVALLFISQVRENIGYTGTRRELVSGGWGPKHYCTLLIELIRTGLYKEHEKPVGLNVKAKVVKNQIAVPFKECEFILRWGKGIDYHHALLLRCKQLGLVVEGAGGWFEVATDGKPIKFQGHRKFAQVASPELIEQMEKAARKAFE